MSTQASWWVYPPVEGEQASWWAYPESAVEPPCIRGTLQKDLFIRRGYTCFQHALVIQIDQCVILEDTTSGLHLL